MLGKSKRNVILILLLTILFSFPHLLLFADTDIILNSNIGDNLNIVPVTEINYADARNDVKKRFYAMTGSSAPIVSTLFYEIEYTTSGWTKNLIDFVTGVTYGPSNIIIDSCRNDGKKRLYLAMRRSSVPPDLYSGTLSEYSWNGSSWTRTEIKTFPVFYGIYGLDKKSESIAMETKIAIGAHPLESGKLKNDGLTRLYVSNYSDAIYEFTWDGTKWVEVKILVHDYDVTAVGTVCLVADARNDGKKRLYTTRYEIEWTGNSWSSVKVPGIGYGWMTLVIGPGRNDGINRIYGKQGGIVGLSEYLDEISWENGSWVKRSYHLQKPKETKLPEGYYRAQDPYSELSVATISDGRNDGVQRVYLVDYHGLWPGRTNLISELTWNGSGWNIKDYLINVDKFLSTRVFAFLSTITPIKANLKMTSSSISDNVAMNKLYTSDMSEYVFAYPQPAYESAKTQTDKLQPVNNYFKQGTGWTTVWYKVDTPGNVTIKLYTINGMPVRTLFEGYRSSGEYSEVWTGRNDSEEIVGSGIYLINIIAPGIKQTKKICIVK